MLFTYYYPSMDVKTSFVKTQFVRILRTVIFGYNIQWNTCLWIKTMSLKRVKLSKLIY